MKSPRSISTPSTRVATALSLIDVRKMAHLVDMPVSEQTKKRARDGSVFIVEKPLDHRKLLEALIDQGQIMKTGILKDGMPPLCKLTMNLPLDLDKAS